MKRTGLIFIFIFLTGLFSGLFFSINLSYENSSYLSSLLLAGLERESAGFLSVFLSVLFSNLALALLMAPALLTKVLCPLPPAILWYKSFAIGFCSGLVYAGQAQQPILISLLKLLPQNVFLIPAFLLLSVVLFSRSRMQPAQKNRPAGRQELLYAIAAAVALIFLGALTEAVFHLIALSPS